MVYFSRLISVASTQQTDSLREHFRKVAVNPSEFVSHTHPTAAKNRTWANNTIQTMYSNAGLIPYSVSMSPKDMRDGLAGSRSYYTAKDMMMPPRNDRVTSRHGFMLIDVDYYVDMHNLLRGNPACLYTFCPRAPGGTSADSTYTVTDDVVTEKINGGAEYSHKLWDYDYDCVVVDHFFYSNVYLVEQRQGTDPDRKLILLTPISTVYLFGWLIQGHRIKRRVMSHGIANYTRYQELANGVTTLYHAMSFKGSSTSAIIDDRSFETILHRTRLSKAPQISDVERILRELGDKNTASASASVFMALWTQQRDLYDQFRRIQTPGFVSDDTYTYQALGPLITEDGKPSLRKIGPQYHPDGYAAAKSYNNDHACINGRLNNIKNKITNYPPFMLKCLAEFAKFIVPDDCVGTGVPISVEEVESHQTRPTQKAKAEQARLWSFNNQFVVKAFQKAEAYAKITDPRNISTVPTDHQLRLSSFTYPMSDILKQQHWYAFGLHPSEFTKTLRDKAATATMCIPTDISRLDGSCGPIHSQVVETVFNRYYSGKYQTEVHSLLKREHNATGITTNGVVYNTGHTTISGSPVTSIRNSLINAYQCYYALRLAQNEPTEAYAKLGIYGGDDGVTFDIDPRHLLNSFTKTGLTLKVEVKQRGDVITFLGRHFVDLWTTSESCCDIARQMRKLHLTHAPSTVPDNLALRRKAEGYLVTDGNTPFITSWATAVIRLTNLNYSEGQLTLSSRFNRWFEQYERPFEPLTSLSKAKMTSYLATEMGITEDQITRAEQRFNDATQLSDLDIGLLTTERAPAQITAAIGGSIVTAASVPKVAKPRTRTQPNKENKRKPTDRKQTPVPHTGKRHVKQQMLV